MSLLLLFLSPLSESLIIYANFLHGAKLKTIPDYHSCRFVREATVWALPSLDIVSRDHQLAGRAFDEPARLSLAGLGDGRRWARLARACGQDVGRGWPRVSGGTAPSSSSGPTSSRSANGPLSSQTAARPLCGSVLACLAFCQDVRPALRSLLRNVNRRAGHAAHEGQAAAAPGPSSTRSLAWLGVALRGAAPPAAASLRPADDGPGPLTRACAVRV